MLDELNLILSCGAAIINFSMSPKTYLAGATLGLISRHTPIAIPGPVLTNSHDTPLRSPLATIRLRYTYFTRFELGYCIISGLVIGLATILYPFTNHQEYSFYNQIFDNFKNYGRSIVYLVLTTYINNYINIMEITTDRLYKEPRMKAFMKKLQDQSPNNMETFKSIFFDTITHDSIIDPVVASNGKVYDRGSITNWMNRGKSGITGIATAPEDRLPLSNKLIKAEAIEILLKELDDNPTIDLSTSKALRDENNVRFITPYIDLKTGKTIEAAAADVQSNTERYKKFFFLQEFSKKHPQKVLKL